MMILGELWKLHDDATIANLDAAAMSLLNKGGARVENETLLNLAETSGCRVDRSAMRCYFSERVVRGAAKALGRGAGVKVKIEAGWDPTWRMTHSGSQPHYLDWPSGERRLATKQDVIDMAKMAHVLDEFTRVGKVLTCAEVDQRIEPLWTSLQIAKTTNKSPASGEVFFANYLDDLVAMGEVITGRKGETCLFPACDFFIQPLIFERNQAACFVKKRQLGLAVCPGTMAVSGMSGPVTIAGTVALSLAELLAGWTLGYLVNPALPASGVVATGTLDMRTMSACFGSPEAILQNVATCNAALRLYGIHPWPIVSYTDCKHPGLQAAFNKMFGLLCAPFYHGRGIGTDGLLSAGQDYSPVQQMLDMEMQKAVDRYWGHFEVSEETLATDLVLDMMKRANTNFLNTDHTFAHYLGEQWYPKWLDRTPWQRTGTELGAEAQMLKRIDAYCKDAVGRYEPPAIDQAKIRELERIYAAAEKRLLA
jgi:trimethylamine--corrinoid protein Co-methyltransferase